VSCELLIASDKRPGRERVRQRMSTLFDEPDGPWALSPRAAAAYAAEGLRFGATPLRVDRGEEDLRYDVNAPSEASGGVGGGGCVHGGFQSLLFDMCGVAAALTSLKRGQLPRGAARLEISYLRPRGQPPASRPVSGRKSACEAVWQPTCSCFGGY
jgi:hypothetical protein